MLIYHYQVIFQFTYQDLKEMLYSLEFLFLYLSTSPTFWGRDTGKTWRSSLLGGLHTPYSQYSPNLPVYYGSVVAHTCSLILVFQLQFWSTAVLWSRIFVTYGIIWFSSVLHFFLMHFWEYLLVVFAGIIWPGISIFVCLPVQQQSSRVQEMFTLTSPLYRL